MPGAPLLSDKLLLELEPSALLQGSGLAGAGGLRADKGWSEDFLGSILPFGGLRTQAEPAGEAPGADERVSGRQSPAVCQLLLDWRRFVLCSLLLCVPYCFTGSSPRCLQLK